MNYTATHKAKVVLDFNPEQGQKLWPALIGRTGSGKTTRADAELVRGRVCKCLECGHKGRPYQRRTILPGTSMPEDILGLPKVEDGLTIYSKTDWIADCFKAPTVVLVDEIDKARSECLATLLTLFAERRVRDIILPQHTLFVAAGQPLPDGWATDETSKAISARLVWVPVADEWEYLANKYDIDLEFMGKSEPPKPPLLDEPSMRQMEWAIQFARAHTTALAREVLQGLMPAKYIKALLETSRPKVKELTGVEAYLSLDNAKDVTAYLEALSASEKTVLVGESLVNDKGDIKLWTAALVSAMLVGDAELRSKLFQHQFDLLGAKAGKNDTVEVLKDSDSDDFARAIDLAAAWIVAVLEKLNSFSEAVSGIYKNKMPDLSSLKK